MKTKKRALFAVLAFVSSCAFAQVPGVINYQGRVVVNGTNFTGTGQFQFALVNGAGGATLWSNGTSAVSVPVDKGLYAVLLGDAALPNMTVIPAGVFANSDVRLRVWFDGGSGLQQLSPDQRIAAVGYALVAATVPASGITGTLSDGQLSPNVALLTGSPRFTGTVSATAFAGNGAGLTNVVALGVSAVSNANIVAGAITGDKIANGTITGAKIAAGTITSANLSEQTLSNTFWRLSGNAGTFSGTHFLGTTDNQALEIKVNSARALRIEPNNAGAPNLIGGASVNTVAASVIGATIGGGGATDISGTAYTNRVDASFGTIGGGKANRIDSSSVDSTIGGGSYNSILTDVSEATLGGGYQNSIQTMADYATLGGGYQNSIYHGAYGTTLGGGYNNSILGNAFAATLGGGYQNRIQTNATRATLSGGGLNTVQTNAHYATIGGGFGNIAGGQYATVPGGQYNSATGTASFAAGRRARALHDGTFVWGDATDADFRSMTSNQFVIRASGGVGIGTNITSGAVLTVAGNVNAAGFIGNGAGLTNVVALGASAVSNANIVSSAITGDKIADGAVTGSKIAAGAVSAANIASGTITGDKIAGGAVSNVNIASNAITGDKIATGAVSADNIAFGTITEDKLAADAITGDKIAGGAVTGDKIALGTVSNVNLSAQILSNTFWRLDGNAGTSPGTHFIGTADNKALEVKVNGARALRLEPNTSGAPNLVGGASVNATASGVVGATIGGGGATAFGGKAYTNRVEAHFGTIGGGQGNTIQLSAKNGTLGGGSDNSILVDAWYATIGGGQSNRIDSAGDYSFIGGGYLNSIDYSASAATLGGGSQNSIGYTADCGTISGGLGNNIQTNAKYATIGGGYHNLAQGDYATVPGGQANSATGTTSFAAGLRAKANHNGAFVWGDSTNADIASTNANSVTLRAAGGYRLYSNAAATLGAQLAANATSWSVMSDRNMKENFRPINTEYLLDRLAHLPIMEWNYKADPTQRRYIGPMAQDFHAAFGLGDDDRRINTMDTDGVALAAIQGLCRQVQAEKERNDALERRLSELEKRLEAK